MDSANSVRMRASFSLRSCVLILSKAATRSAPSAAPSAVKRGTTFSRNPQLRVTLALGIGLGLTTIGQRARLAFPAASSATTAIDTS